MIKNKTKDEMPDNEPVVDRTGCECYACDPDYAAAGAESADNVADESFEAGDNSAQMSDMAEEWKDKYLRLQAEFDNYRKRTLKEKMDLVATGGEGVIKALLGVIDDLDRALASVQSAGDVEAVKEGVDLIYNKLTGTLRSKGLSEIECIGEGLDTDLHEAVAKLPVSDDMKGKIVDVVQKGYKLNDKVVRFAKVVVGE